MRIAHLADQHLGFRQFHRQAPSGINQREQDVANAFRASIDGVLAARPDAVLLAGDLFHAVRPSNAAIVFAFRQLQRVRDALPEAPIVLIAGNHDTPRSSDSGSILRLYEELGVDVAYNEARQFVYPRLDLQVMAVPWQALQAEERPSLRPTGPERHRILVLHGEMEGAYPSALADAPGAAVVTRDQLPPDGWSYVALGHYHVQSEVQPRTWYAGALEYVSPNYWGELREEERRGRAGKGWLLVDLTSGSVTPQPIPQARRIVDLPPLFGEGLAAPELDRLLRERLESLVGGYEDQVIRQVVHGVTREVGRALDHAALRSFKAKALHYQLDLRRPEAEPRSGVDAAGRRLPLPDLLREYLARRPLPAEIDREAFVTAGSGLLDAVIREEEG